MNDDPVDDFFASHRDRIESAPADDLTWQGILRDTRQSPSRAKHRAWVSVTSAAVAAVLALFAVWTWQREPLVRDDIRTGQQVEQTTAPTDGALDATEDAAAPQQPTDVPATFRTWSVSNAGSGTIYNLGSTECGSDICPTLLRSTADGGSWTAVHTFASTDTSSATGADVPMIQPDRALSQVRFLNSQVGYVYGGDLWVTTDRGASFSRVNHPGQTVLDLEIWQGQIYLLTADGCVQGRCAGPVYVASSNRDSVRSFTTLDSAAIRGTIDDASIVVKGNTIVVQTGKDGVPQQQPWRVVSDRLEPMAGPRVCGTSPLEAVTVTASTDAQLFALCRSGGEGGFRVLNSKDDGASWTMVSENVLRLPNIGQLNLAAADPKHLVVTVGGPRGGNSATGIEANQALQVSADGGATWSVVKPPEPAPVNGFDWCASPGGAEFYAVARTTPGYWASSDFGKTWKVVVPTS
ncbi:hypothetical protein IEE94_04050 [Yimella sp. cx-573]|nr:hypothetical protein [Yimella sp. cx-573]